MKKGMKLFLGVITCCFCALPFMSVNAATSLQDKINAANSGDVVTLEQNETTPISINGKNITIDLNGYNITTSGSAIVVESGAELTITGSGNVDAYGSRAGAIVNKGGTVIINSGNFNSQNWYTVKNFGNAIINGGTFTQGNNGAVNTSNASLVVNGWACGTSTCPDDVGFSHTSGVAVLTINGGTFVHNTTTSTIKSDDWSKTNITGGSFTSAQGFLVQATGEVNISGGDFKGYNSIAVLYAPERALEYEPGILNISNGTFDAKYVVDPRSDGDLSISGGTFKIEAITCVGNIYDYTKNITGGTFSVDVSNDVATNYVVVMIDDKYVVMTSEEAENLTEVSSDSDNTTEYDDVPKTGNTLPIALFIMFVVATLSGAYSLKTAKSLK